MERADIQQTIGRMNRLFPWLRRPGIKRGNEATQPLEKLPFVTSSVLEEHYYADTNPLSGRADLHAYRTSGTSSGRRKTIYYSAPDEEHYIRIKLNMFRTILGAARFRSALADMGTGHAEATAVEVFRRLGMEAESISFRMPIERHLERLAALQPEVLYTMPSILDRILHAAGDPSSYGIRHVILVGEIASPVWIRQAARRLGLGEEHITDTYGSIEIGNIAYFSHEHGRYLVTEGLWAEGVLPEEIDNGLEPLTDDDERVLVLTSAVREAFPALRYVTYDVVRDLSPIWVDGVLRQSFAGVVKRIGPDLKHGEKISIYDIESVVLRHLEGAGVRIKVAGNALIVYVHSPRATAAALERVRDDLERRIPEIGMMIQARILGGIQVIPDVFEDSLYISAVKNKKIFYE